MALRTAFALLLHSQPTLALVLPHTRAVVTTLGLDEDDKKLQDVYDEYDLPYGILGAISHVIQMYMLGCHFFGRRPLMPWKHLEHHLINICATIAMAIVTVTVSALSVSRVQGSRELVTLLVMNMVFGIVLDAVHVHRYVRRSEKGLITGLAGWLVILMGVSLAASQMIEPMTSKTF